MILCDSFIYGTKPACFIMKTNYFSQTNIEDEDTLVYFRENYYSSACGAGSSHLYLPLFISF